MQEPGPDSPLTSASVRDDCRYQWKGMGPTSAKEESRFGFTAWTSFPQLGNRDRVAPQGRFGRVVSLSHSVLMILVGIEWRALLIQWQMLLKGLAERLALHLFKEEDNPTRPRFYSQPGLCNPEGCLRKANDILQKANSPLFGKTVSSLTAPTSSLCYRRPSDPRPLSRLQV